MSVFLDWPTTMFRVKKYRSCQIDFALLSLDISLISQYVGHPSSSLGPTPIAYAVHVLTCMQLAYG